MGNLSSISRALKLVRQFHRLSQTEVAERIGVSKSYLCELESGKKTPTVGFLQAYSKEFDLPASTLLLMAERFDGKISTKQQSKVEKILHFLEWASDGD